MAIDLEDAKKVAKAYEEMLLERNKALREKFGVRVIYLAIGFVAGALASALFTAWVQ